MGYNILLSDNGDYAQAQTVPNKQMNPYKTYILTRKHKNRHSVTSLAHTHTHTCVPMSTETQSGKIWHLPCTCNENRDILSH